MKHLAGRAFARPSSSLLDTRTDGEATYPAAGSKVAKLSCRSRWEGN
jgi:hypothetical protein